MKMINENLEDALETIEGLHKELNRQIQLRYKAAYLHEAELERAKADRFYNATGAHGMSCAFGFAIGVNVAILMILGSCI